MTATTTRQKLYDFIQQADDDKVQAIYNLLQVEELSLGDHWNNEEFVAELNRRSDRRKAGAKGVPWKEVKARIEAKLQKESK